MRFVPGTPTDPEALIVVPLIARARIKGMLNIYRIGEDGLFTDDEFELAKRFGDAAALALDNAQIRARLEHQAQTDSLTGLFNHRSFHERLLHRAAGREPHARDRRGPDARHRRLQAGQRRPRSRRRRRAALRLADTLRVCVRPEDVVCRLGGEEFGVIMRSCDWADAAQSPSGSSQRLARARRSRRRHAHRLDRDRARPGARDEPARADRLCRGGDDDREGARQESDRPLRRRRRPSGRDAPAHERDVRSIAHLKMLQSLSGKLNRLNDVREIGMTIANELR